MYLPILPFDWHPISIEIKTDDEVAYFPIGYWIKEGDTVKIVKTIKPTQKFRGKIITSNKQSCYNLYFVLSL